MRNKTTFYVIDQCPWITVKPNEIGRANIIAVCENQQQAERARMAAIIEKTGGRRKFDHHSWL